MSVSQLYVGSIIEDLRTNSIYEITGVTLEEGSFDEVFRYTVRTLVNPMDVKINEIRIASVDQLGTLHFYNVESKADGNSGLVSFPITTMFEDDSTKLASIDIFLNNYFYKVRSFSKGKDIYRVKLESLENKTVKIVRSANFLERFLFNKITVPDVIDITDLFESYTVHVAV